MPVSRPNRAFGVWILSLSSVLAVSLGVDRQLRTPDFQIRRQQIPANRSSRVKGLLLAAKMGERKIPPISVRSDRTMAPFWQSCHHETAVVQGVVVKPAGLNVFQRPQLNNTKPGARRTVR